MTRYSGTTPSWWPAARNEIDQELHNFADKVEKKLIEFAQQPLKHLAKKNLFLYRLRGVSSPEELAETALQAFSSSSEETMFGQLLENCAIIVGKHARQGRKSAIEGIDMEYGEKNLLTILQIKSGKNWGNSSQHKQMASTFAKARRIYTQGSPNRQIQCIEGIAYGERQAVDKGNHWRYVGPAFWEEISGGWGTLSKEFMDVLAKHAQNGFNEAREHARIETARVLEAKQLVQNDAILWTELHNCISEGTWKKNHRSNPAQK